MTNKIMELADEYARYSHDDLGFPQLPKSSRAALATEVQAQQDYTRAVIAERDALKAELKKEEDAHDADVNDLNYHLRNSITNHKQAEDELEALRKANLDCVDHFNAIREDYMNLLKAAQMALVALESLFPHDDYEGAVAVWRLGGSHAPRLAIEAIRKELGQ